MISPEDQKLVFQNALLIALIDGQFVQGERLFLQEMMKHMALPAETTKLWYDELHGGQISLKKISDPTHARLMLKIAIGVSSADGNLPNAQKKALLELAELNTIAKDELQTLFAECWGKNASQLLLSPHTPVDSNLILAYLPSGEANSELKSALEPGLAAALTQYEQISSKTAVIIFEAKEKKEASLHCLKQLMQRAPKAACVALVHRHHAPQISYLLEAGLKKVLITPLRPGELRKAIENIHQD